MLIIPSPSIISARQKSLGSLVAPGTSTTVTPSATANTKGSYAQLLAAASNTIQTRSLYLRVQCNPGQAVPGRYWLVDIAIGGSGSEVVVIPNFVVYVQQQFNLYIASILLPFSIPAGTRIAARCQTNISSASDTINVGITLYSGGEGANGIDALNIDTATSTNTTNITPGNGSKGSYAEIISSTTKPYKGLFIIPDTRGNSSQYSMTFNDIAIGTTVILADMEFAYFGGTMEPWHSQYFPISIPAGSQLQMRTYSTGTQNNLGVAAYGVY